MASEQKGNRKKPSRNTVRGEHKHPVLYRHQECIPTSKIFHECERNNIGLVNLKNNLDIELTGRLIKEDKVSNINPINKQFNSKLKSEDSQVKEDCKVQDPKLDKHQIIESESSNSEEFSKSRKRRLRKQKLLASLAPTSSTTVKLNTCVENNPQSKPVPQSTIRLNSVPAPTTGTGTVTGSIANRLGETGKQSLKESRKRLDKSVGTRNKSIKGKTLAESVSQTKADIIKSLEEKTLTSLLQTLVPLTNSSPKKEKPPVPLFSFNDKKLSASDSKVGKDEVFYFGETKHQLEKLATGFNKNSSVINKEKLESGQNSKVDKFNSFSGSTIGNLDNCISPFNFSSVFAEQNINITSVKGNFCNFEAPQTSKEDSKIPFCFGSNNQDLNLKDQNPKTQVSKTQNQYPGKAVIFNRTPYTNSAVVPNNLPVAFPKSKTEIATEGFTENQSYKTLIPVQEELKHNNISLNAGLENCTASVMDPIDEKLKSNKTREEIKLEREAKKAAKLAAKAKHKTAQSSKDSSLTALKKFDGDTKQVTELEEKYVEKVSTSSTENPPTLNQQMNKSTASNVKLSNSLPIKEVNNEEKIISETLQETVNVATTKSKAELRAERRAKQEAQRAAKVLPKQPQQKDKIVIQAKIEPKTDISTKPAEKKQEVTKAPIQPKPKLFSHLYQEKSPLTSKEILLSGGLHPAIVRLGVQYATRVIAGSNARCIALLNALKQMVTDYSTPLEKEFSRGLEEELGPVTVYLNQCRPLAVSMTNALRHIKRTLTQLPNNIPDVEARQKICDVVDTYIHEQIDVAGTAICNTVKDKIADGDVILTYGCSSLVYKILIQSHLSGKRFRVVVVDGLPWREGREMLRRLVDKGLSCTYVLITAASFIMREASKVLLGAHALLANGCVMSRAGSSQVALLAHCYNVPVLVCCEMHKFSERVQTDAFVYNELGVLESTKDKEKTRMVANLTPLSLAYDITPPDLVSAVVTELAVLPCTSVPVILRIKPSESLM